MLVFFKWNMLFFLYKKTLCYLDAHVVEESPYYVSYFCLFHVSKEEMGYKYI